MCLATLTRSLLLIPMIVTALLVAAPAAQADCEFQGDVKAGTIDCVRWAEDETPGTGEQPPGADGGTSQVDNPGGGTGSNTAAAPICRDDQGAVVPCTTVNENGTTCYFSGTIGATPDGSGGGAIYICPTPADDDADPDEPAPSGASGTAPDDPVVVAWQAVASLGLQAVDMQIAPTPLSADADSMGLVRAPVWLWAEPTPTTWGCGEPLTDSDCALTASASDGPVSVTVTARVDRVEWDMGDGTRPISCGIGTSFVDEEGEPSYSATTQSPDCGHVYKRTSRSEPDRAYTVTATSYWVAEWTADTGASGTIPFELTSSEQIRIGEMQVLRTTGGAAGIATECRVPHAPIEYG